MGIIIISTKHSDSKNVANGMAGLDSNILLSPAVIYPIVEEYSSHLGVIDNFMEAVVTGTGSVTSDSTNHEVDLDTGVTEPSTAMFRSKDNFTPGLKPIVINNIPSVIPTGFHVGGHSEWFVGLANQADPYHGTIGHSAGFSMWAHVGGMKTGARNSNGTSYTFTQFNISADDLLTIIITSSKTLFYVNGVKRAEHTTTIPTNAMRLSMSVSNKLESASVATSIDFVSIKKFK